MWSLRRASVHLRNRGLSCGTTQIFCVKSEIAKCYLENHNSGIVEPQAKQLDGLIFSARFYNSSSSSWKSYVEIRSLHSQADANSNKGQDDDLEETFPGPEKHDASGIEIDDDSFSESEVSGEDAVDDMQNELESSGEKLSPKTRAITEMTKVILAAPGASVGKALDKWVEEGNEVTKTDVSSTTIHLRNRKMFFKALQLSEWLESTQKFEFIDRNYASRVDLLAKVHGISVAEKYIQKMPESFRGELVYRTLLANCVFFNDQKKSEQVFNKMKDSFSITIFACNQMLLLYKRTDYKKVPEVLKLMEKENIKPTLFTYKILIDVKGQSNDITGIEKLLETMKSEGLEPNIQIQASLARRYAICGLKEKAEAVLKEMEGDDLIKNRWVCRLLLPIYASLKREDEVERIWKVCEPNPRLQECMAGVEAWGKLGRIKDAESTFEKMVKKLKNPATKHYAVLLDVYANHKMLDKGKELVKRMVEGNTPVGPYTWHVLVKLYVGAGEVEKADSILENAVKKRKAKPWFTSYVTVLDEYAKRGDVHNSEKMLVKIREGGYGYLTRPYQMVLTAYVNGKVPGYGFNERLKGDNVILNNAIRGLMGRVNAFRKSPVDELLEG